MRVTKRQPEDAQEELRHCAVPASLTPPSTSCPPWVLLPSSRPPVPPVSASGEDMDVKMGSEVEGYVLMLITLPTAHDQTDIVIVNKNKKDAAKKAKNNSGGVTKVTGRDPGGSLSRAERRQLRQAGLSNVAIAARAAMGPIASLAPPPPARRRRPPSAPPTSASGEATDIEMGVDY
ncbi:uncharacterized protein TrAtP1_006265 [Trichoderma atroviride]|uniref:uncharacterized protein n=1 Tax=Hypocrea atroviridis TaxID=63577 RepID=UPI00332F656D|nr:hypothetical protein TrAtP1_006265 [Trichoderma atroviride]